MKTARRAFLAALLLVTLGSAWAQQASKHVLSSDEVRKAVPSEYFFRGQKAPVQLPPKAFDALLVMVENRGRLLEKDELLRKVWPDASSRRMTSGSGPREETITGSVPQRRRSRETG